MPKNACNPGGIHTSLYDTYKMAIRWASDRIGEQGVVAVVTNGSWIDSHVDSGVRACLAEEFTSIYVLNLRGNARTSGELRRKEGDNVFGQGSRAPVAITVLVRNPNAVHDGGRILYRDIGDYLTREDKLAFLREKGSIMGIDDWKEIAPDRHHDWIGQRSEEFGKLYPIGSKEAKAGKTDEAIFKLFSNGYKTGRDAYVYNFSRSACAENARRMVDDYCDALEEFERIAAPVPNLRMGNIVDDLVSRYSANVRWDRELKNNLRRRKEISYFPENIWQTQYRPFVKQHCYLEYLLASNKYQMDSIFPNSSQRNVAICLPGMGSTKPFSALIVDSIPDLHLIEFGQCFPRYRYQRSENAQDELPGLEPELERADNVTDTALRVFRIKYGDNSISKDAIFDYVYAVLHHPDYRERFANDLTKELPRIPFAADFHAFAEAGRRLADLHLQYENCDEYPLDVEFSGSGEPRPEHFRFGERAMRFIDEKKTTLRINDHVRLSGIPDAAHRYQVNGRTPLGWFIDRYRFVQDSKSGIVNEPNGWFAHPRELVAAIQRVVYVSVETDRIVKNLPDVFTEGRS